jgi:hypothetical protein
LTLTARGRATLETVRGEIRLRLAGSLKSLPAPDQKDIQRAMKALRRAFVPQTAPADRAGRNEP